MPRRPSSLRADDSSGARAASWLAAAGALAGLLFLVRPTNLAFMAALLAFAVLHFRLRCVPFVAAALLLFLLSVGWNYAFFHTWIGPSASQTHSYNFAAATFVSGFIGLAISPVRGLIPNSPFLLFALPAMAAAIGYAIACVLRWDFRNADADRLLFALLLGASAAFYLSYSFSPFWEGGTYGSRYLSEMMPILVYFLNYSRTVHRIVDRSSSRIATALFGAAVAIGVFQQVTAIVGGHKGTVFWADMPYSELDVPEDRRWAYMREAPLRSFETRLWSVSDGQVARIWRGLYSDRFVLNARIAGATRYSERCKATILAVKDAHGRDLDGATLTSIDGSRPYADRLWEMLSGGRKFLHVLVRNDGEVPLYGYRSGLTWGFAVISAKIFNENGVPIAQRGSLFVSQRIDPGQVGEAIGSLEITTNKGSYRIEAQMAINGIGPCGPLASLGTVIVE